MNAPIEKGLARWSFPIAVALMIVWGVNFSVTKIILYHIPVCAILSLPFFWMRLLGPGLLRSAYPGASRDSLPLPRPAPPSPR